MYSKIINYCVKGDSYKAKIMRAGYICKICRGYVG